MCIALRRSRKGAWIEIPTLERLWPYGFVAPARERGLKCPMPMYGIPGMMVAPARERGLKFVSTVIPFIQEGRSRKGAWIEIA